MTQTADAAGEAVRAVDPSASPFKGLTFFTEDDAEIFFGRDGERQLIAATLLASRFTIVYGESGVGKSSLLRAGVLHDLRERAEQKRSAIAAKDGGRRGPPFIPVVFSNWRDDPVPALDACIRSAARHFFAPEELPEPFTVRAVDELVERWCGHIGATLLIVLDQFEDYLLYHPAEDGEDSFDAGLARAISRRDLNVRFIVSIREDAVAKLDRYENLIPNLFENYLRVEHLDEAAAEEAIRGPVEKHNDAVGPDEQVKVDDDLVAAVLTQVQTGPLVAGGNGTVVGNGQPSGDGTPGIETAFLQLVMERIWKVEQGAGSHVLRLETLERLGGGKEIVLDHLRSAMSALKPDQRDIAARLFRDLVTPSGQKIAQLPSDLAKIEELEEPRVRAVLEELEDQRIVRGVAPAPGSSESRYEIFHDKLADPILGWRARYVEKRQREEAEKRARELLRAAARKRRLRVLVGLGVVAAAGVVAALVWLLVVGAEQAKISKSRQLAASAMAILPANPEESIALAAKGERKHDTAEAQEALRRALGESRLRAILPLWGSVKHVSLAGSDVAATIADGTLVVSNWRTGRRLLTVHGEWNFPPAVAPTGSFAVVEKKGVYHVWDLTKRKEISRFAHPGGYALLPAFSASGRLVATTAANQVLVRDLSRRPVTVGPRAGAVPYKGSQQGGGLPGGKPGRRAVWPGLVRFPAGREQIDAVALTASGDRVATATADIGIRVWSVRSHSHFVQLGKPSRVDKLVFSPDGRVLLAVGKDGKTRAWNTRTGRLLATLYGSSVISDAAFSPDGRLALTVAGTDVTVWDTSRWTAEAIRHDSDYVLGASFSPSSQLVITATRGATAWVWDALTGQTLLVLPHSNIVDDARFAPDGRLAVTAGADGAVRLWDVDTGRELTGPGAGHMETAAFSPDGRRIATAGDDDLIRVWSTRGHRKPETLRGHTDLVSGVSFDRTGSRVASASWDHTARVWNLKTKRSVVLRGHKDNVISVDFARDGRVVTASQDHTAIIWSSRTGRPLHRLRRRDDVSGDYVVDAAFNPSGSQVATASWDGTVRIWNSRTGKREHTLREHRGGVNAVAYSPDGRLLVSAGLDKTAIVWDTRTWKERRVLRGHTQPLWDASFSPDGKRVVTAAADGTARVWDVASGRVVAVLQRGTSAIDSASFDPADGTRILTANDEGFVEDGHCETCDPIRKLVGLARKRTPQALRRKP